jgi:hypothetical protein
VRSVTFENVAQVRVHCVTTIRPRRRYPLSLDWEYGETMERSLEALEQAKVELMRLRLSPAWWLARRSRGLLRSIWPSLEGSGGTCAPVEAGEGGSSNDAIAQR